MGRRQPVCGCSSHFISLRPVRAWRLGPSQARILTVSARIGKARWCVGWRESSLALPSILLALFPCPERPPGGCWGPLPSPPLRSDNETAGSFSDRPCSLCRNASAWTEASPSVEAQGRPPQGHARWHRAGLLCRPGERGLQHLGPSSQAPCVGGQIEGC